MSAKELSMMDVPTEMLEALKCSECDKYLARSPIYLGHDGAAVCGGCFAPKHPATRNTHYEALASLVRFPCKNRELGCRSTVGFASEGQEVAHEATCVFRKYECPVLGSARCDWLGPRSQVLQHCRAQHPDEPERCVGCLAAVTVMLYQDQDGWRCERCAPPREACRNQAQGCDHQDIRPKCSKHERFFCQQSNWCDICREQVSRGTVSAHYASAHGDEWSSAGSTWRATLGGRQHCLVTSPAGTALCRYWLYNYLNDARFDVHVHIPVLTERLCEFRCEVRVTHPTTRLSHTYTPDIEYTGMMDWSIKIRNDDFPSWSEEFEISVNIIKK